MRAHTQPTGGGLNHVWLTHGTSLAAFLLTTTPEHAARIVAAVNAPGSAGRPVINALSTPGYLNLRLARREQTDG